MSFADFQFILRMPSDERWLLSEISNILGFVVDSVDYPATDAVGVVQVVEHEGKFKRSYLVSYPATDEFNHEAFARELAVKIGDSVLIEIGSSQRWLYVDAKGRKRDVNVIDTEDGLDIVQR